MGRKPTCPHCGEIVEKDEAIKQYSGRKYHMACYKEAMKIKYESKQEQLEPRDKLYAYICEIYDLKEVTPMIKAQIEKYMTENPDWRYSGVEYTIRYIVEVEKQDILNDVRIRGVGFLPYKYDIAKKHFLAVKKANDLLEEQLEEKSLEDFITQRTVRVKTPDYSIAEMIDIEEL